MHITNLPVRVIKTAGTEAMAGLEAATMEITAEDGEVITGIRSRLRVFSGNGALSSMPLRAISLSHLTELSLLPIYERETLFTVPLESTWGKILRRRPFRR